MSSQVDTVHEIKLDDLVETEVDGTGTVKKDADRTAGTADLDDRIGGATENGCVGDSGIVDGEQNQGSYTNPGVNVIFFKVFIQHDYCM